MLNENEPIDLTGKLSPKIPKYGYCDFIDTNTEEPCGQEATIVVGVIKNNKREVERKCQLHFDISRGDLGKYNK
jgi:hypothetical protein